MLEIGSIVRSKRGRDKDRFYVVVTLNGDFVGIVDGKVRKIGKPKQKNVKHLSVTNKNVNLMDVTSDKFLRGILEPMNRSLSNHKNLGGN